MYTLGINFSHHGSIALLKDNEVVLFCLEERFNRQKEWGGGKLVPRLSLSLIKQFTNSINYVCAVSGSSEQLKQSVSYLKEIGISVDKAGINNAAHHLYHAAAGFYMSHFDDASCVVIDGAGALYKFSKKLRASETTSFYEVDYTSGFTCIHKTLTVGVYDGGGIKTLTDNYPDRKDTGFEITEHEIQSFSSQLKQVASVDVSTQLDTGLKFHCGSAKVGIMLGWKKLQGCDGKVMGLAAYGNNSESTKEQQLAYETQKILEKDFIEKIKKCQSKNIVLSGGCALNILGNSLIKTTYPDLNLFIDPVAHDGTIALGAATYNYYKISRCTDKLVYTPYSGPQYNYTVEDVYEYTRKHSL